jgi:hypothetical protein
VNKIKFAIMSAVLMTTPAHAQGSGDRSETTQMGVFVGARMTLSLSGRTAAKPRTMLAIAPTQLRQSVDGSRKMRIGEGFALNLNGSATPTLTVGKDVVADRKLGISTGGWIAIGAGVVATVGAVGVLYLRELSERTSD